jgi:hypothetical protein
MLYPCCMTAISNAAEPTDRRNDLPETRTCSSPHIIEFFSARDRMFANSHGNTEQFGYRHEEGKVSLRRELSHPFSDPIEDGLYTLISGAALAALLIGILCLPCVTPKTTESSLSRPISHADSFLPPQKPVKL